MTERQARWRAESTTWVSALALALQEQHQTDVVVPYNHVALAFPSIESHPLSYTDPLLDHEELRLWASRQGWQVKPAPDMKGDDDTDPPIRFTKTARGLNEPTNSSTTRSRVYDAD